MTFIVFIIAMTAAVICRLRAMILIGILIGPLHPGEYVAPYYKTPDRAKLSCNPDGPNDIVWADASYYAPTNQTNYADHTPTPPFSQRRQAMNFRTEGEWLDYVRNRDQPSGYYFQRVGICACDQPVLKLDGYTRSLPSMPGRELFLKPWPRSDAWTPPVRRGRGEYYGYYHERIELERARRHNEQDIEKRILPQHLPANAYNHRWGFNQA